MADAGDSGGTRRRFLRGIGAGVVSLGIAGCGSDGRDETAWGSAVHYPAERTASSRPADPATVISGPFRRHENDLHWHAPPVTFSVGTSTYPDYLDADAVTDAITASFDAWNGVPGTETVFTPTQLDPDLEAITFENGTNEIVWEEMPDDSLGRAHWRWDTDTSRLLEVDVRLNPNRTWFLDAATAGGNLDAYDVQSVLMHELGHCALLDVMDAPEQTMFHETAANTAKKRTLESGDEAGWRDAYGTSE